MTLNAYAVLDGFLASLRLVLGVLVLLLGAAGWRAWRRHARDAERPEGRTAVEDRGYLLFLLAGVLLVLNVAAWPVFYLLLLSYVPQMPEVMCIYGVTQVGAGSWGPARFLPRLVTALEAAKPALVFLSGAWFVLYLLDRRTASAPLTGRVLALLVAAGLLSVGDASAELAYLAIPKKEDLPTGGCCMEAFDVEGRATRFLPRALTTEEQVPALYAAYYALNGGLALALGVASRLCRRGLRRAWLAPLLLGAAASVVVNGVFLVEVAAPRWLRLPYHHCPYDLVGKAPETLLAVALFLAGSFAVGWACVAGWLGRSAQTRPFLAGQVGGLLHLAALAYLGSLVMTSVELALA